MNNTKWKELIGVLESIPGFSPAVSIKYTSDENENPGFSPVWWDQVEQEGFRHIEWIKINPCKAEYIGRLVNTRVIDYSDLIEKGLQSCSIPFEKEDGILIIYA